MHLSTKTIPSVMLATIPPAISCPIIFPTLRLDDKVASIICPAIPPAYTPVITALLVHPDTEPPSMLPTIPPPHKYEVAESSIDKLLIQFTMVLFIELPANPPNFPPPNAITLTFSLATKVVQLDIADDFAFRHKAP